jgi:hypothetical protein
MQFIVFIRSRLLMDMKNIGDPLVRNPVNLTPFGQLN